jgi:hypothetical protein
MIKKQFVLKRVNFGNRRYQSYRLIQFETFDSYRQRGGKINAAKRLKYQPAVRNLMSTASIASHDQLKLAA